LLTALTGEPVAGAKVSTSSVPATTTSSVNGSFALTGPTGFWRFTFEAPGYVERSSPVRVLRPTDILDTLISTAAPFSLEYFRELVRGKTDNDSALQPVRRWLDTPRYFFLTRTLDTGTPIPDAIIDAMQAHATFLTPRLTDNRYTVGAFGRGEAPPASLAGWIIVETYANGIPDAPGAGGNAFVGANPGRIRLLFRPEAAGSQCQYRMAGAFYHEVVHALGFWHAPGGFSVDNSCGELLPDVTYHARIAYLRPPGNLDPDWDPDWLAGPALQVKIVR
jgi:hypothetical protein